MLFPSDILRNPRNMSLFSNLFLILNVTRSVLNSTWNDESNYREQIVPSQCTKYMLRGMRIVSFDSMWEYLYDFNWRAANNLLLCTRHVGRRQWQQEMNSRNVSIRSKSCERQTNSSVKHKKLSLIPFYIVPLYYATNSSVDRGQENKNKILYFTKKYTNWKYIFIIYKLKFLLFADYRRRYHQPYYIISYSNICPLLGIDKPPLEKFVSKLKREKLTLSVKRKN